MNLELQGNADLTKPIYQWHNTAHIWCCGHVYHRGLPSADIVIVICMYSNWGIVYICCSSKFIECLYSNIGFIVFYH
jgi:hypothetical protein